MVDRLVNILNSRFTPIVCLVIGGIVNQFTYDMSNGTFFRAVEIVLFAIALIAAIRTYNSWSRYVLISLCALGLLISGIDLIPSKSHDSSNQTNSSREDSEYQRHFDGNDSYYFQVNDSFESRVSDDSIKQKCYHCNGSGKCSECGGTGRISIEKQGIDLGNGGSTYQQHMRCPLCDGDRKCVWCSGKGYNIY